MLRKNQAFSLTELMIGVGLLATCILMLAMLLTMAFRIAQRGIDYSAATGVAELVLERYLQDHPQISPTAPVETGTWTLNRSVYNYQIKIEAVNTDLVKLTASLSWTPSGSGDKPLVLNLSRLIYINKSTS